MLHNSVLSVQLEKCKKKKKKTQRSATISKVAGRNCTKSNTPTRLPNCTNGTKSRNSSHIHIY